MKVPDSELFLPCVESPTRLVLTALQLGPSVTNGTSQTQQQQHLGASSKGDIYVSQQRQEWIWIDVEDDLDAGFAYDNAVAGYLKSVKHGFYLTALIDQRVGTVETQAEANCWRMITSAMSDTIQLEVASQDSKLVHTMNGQVATIHKEATMLEANSYHWQVQFLTGELCFLQHPASDSRLRCDVFGKVTIDKNNWKGWEVFRFIQVTSSAASSSSYGGGSVTSNTSTNTNSTTMKDREYIITSWTHDTRALATNQDGQIFTTNRYDPDNEIQHWKVRKAPLDHGSSPGLWIESVSYPQQYLSVQGNKLDICKHNVYSSNRSASNLCWHLEPANRYRFYISNPFMDRRLSSSKEGEISSSSKRNKAEEWKVEKLSDGSFVIQSTTHDGRYLAVEDMNDGSSESPKLSTLEAPERWHIEESAHGGVIISAWTGSTNEEEVQLSCTGKDDGVILLDCENSFGKSETWHLEPILPSSKSGSQLAFMAGTVAAVAIAAPFAVSGLVAALGFEASGVVAGSIGAGMMSAEAVASGGAIAAGGTVATLQSIGAVGLGLTGTTVAAGGGAAIGTGIVGSASVLSENKGVGKTTVGDDLEHLPLSAWRWWGETAGGALPSSDEKVPVIS